MENFRKYFKWKPVLIKRVPEKSILENISIPWDYNATLKLQFQLIAAIKTENTYRANE